MAGERTRRADRALRAAAIVQLLNALGFGIGAVATVQHLSRVHELPLTPFGFRAFSGPFEALGTERFTGLLCALAAVCGLEAVAGVWLWQGRQRGATLSLATTPFAIALGAGFALPIYLAGIPLRLGLLWLGRGNLR